MSGTPSVDTSEVRRALASLTRQSPALRDRVLRRSAEQVLAEAGQTGVVPRKTGNLAGSTFIDAPRSGSVAFGYGADYAAAVHERHPSKAQWFLRAINQHARRVVLAEARDALERAVRKARGGRA